MSEEPLTASAASDFEPVSVRFRHDGWTPERQVGLIEALAESGCVAEAARSVGMSIESAYALRRRIDAQSFRKAWSAALTFAMRRLADAVVSRAINGVAIPHFYKGEKVGEHRRYDDRLAMFLLRYRDPLIMVGSVDESDRRVEQFANRLGRIVNDLEDDAYDRLFDREGLPPRSTAKEGEEGDGGAACHPDVP